MKHNIWKSASFLSRTVVSSICLFGVSAFVFTNAQAQQRATSLFGSEMIAGSDLKKDPTKPVSRGYIEPSVTAIPGGIRVAVDIWQDRLNSPVTLILQAAVNPGNGQTQVIPLKLLSDNIIDNPKFYHSKREFDFSYAELNAILQKSAPNASGLKIEPGTPLFVYANFSGHQWGGVQRGGIIFMPEDKAQAAKVKAVSTAAVARPTALDVAYPIGAIANRYNEVGTVKDRYGNFTTRGLKPDGQIRSRVEAEGKFQIPLDQMDGAKKALFELANDPVKAAALLGTEWTLKLEDRYLKKDVAGKIVMGADGYPVSEPMVDTYYDNKNNDAAKNDMAIRFRSMEKTLNGTVSKDGAWNLKSGQNVYTKEGVVYRVEYGLDATDERPGTIAKFANSDHPLNFFKIIPQLVPGTQATDFLLPSVKLTDFRYKFMLHHKSGLAIEVSLDEVHAESLRKNQGKGKVIYGQLEMDVDHMALASANVAASSNLLGSQPSNNSSGRWVAFTTNINDHTTFMTALDGKAFLDGRPVLHDASDLKSRSPVRMTHGADFKSATTVISAIRDHVAGKNFLPAPQKYAYAAAAIGIVSEAEQSASVKKLIALKKAHEKVGSNTGLLFKHPGIAECGAAAFN